MLTWILIGLLIVVAVLFIKLSHFRHRIFVVTIIIIAVFLYVSITYVASKNSLDFTSSDGLSNAFKVYFGWLFNLAGNVKGLTGSAIRMDWTSTNASLPDFGLDNQEVSINSKPSKITTSASARFAGSK